MPPDLAHRKFNRSRRQFTRANGRANAVMVIFRDVRSAPEADISLRRGIGRRGPILLKKAAVATHDIH